MGKSISWCYDATSDNYSDVYQRILVPLLTSIILPNGAQGRPAGYNAKVSDQKPATWHGNNPQDDITWEWSALDLSKYSPWYKDRVKSILQAIEGDLEAERWYRAGLQALAIHRENYTVEGPKHLQLLWWEFPKEHWEPLCEGSSRHFLVTPEGELVLNSAMDDMEQEAAGRFIDELILLGVLLPAEGCLRANCPLFCVDKANQPGQKRCIADMKRDGQNACIGKDPVYHFPKRNHSTPILPWRLFSRCRHLEVVDTSK
jgi:hypothetical protein